MSSITSSSLKFRGIRFLKLVSLWCLETKPNLYYVNVLQLSPYSASAVCLNNSVNLAELCKTSRLVTSEAQNALTEYFHVSRCFYILDAENMSKNTPEFFNSLATRVHLCNGYGSVGRSLARFLNYHPIYEFEPFFESIGLKPFEYVSFLPRNKMFLNEDALLLENYYVLCHYGITRNRIGRIYKHATEVFKRGPGVLLSKLRSLENLGLKQSVVGKIVVSSPCLLRDNIDQDFIEVLAKLRNAGIGCDWLGMHISVDERYNWKCMLDLISLLSKLGLSEVQIGELLTRHPHLLLESSGRSTSCLFGFMLKFGSTPTKILDEFHNFPEMSVVNFTNNLYNSYAFLTEIGMAAVDIGWIIRSHPKLLGMCVLKKAISLLNLLNCGKKALCQMLKNDPFVLKKWARGLRVDHLQKQKRDLKRTMKTKFLLSIGFKEKSKEMERAYRGIRGNAEELQERFDCLVNFGFSHEGAIEMVKSAPQILDQPKDVIEMKLQFFVRDLGFKLPDFLSCPSLLTYGIEKVRVRFTMHEWLKKEGVVPPKVALSTLLMASENRFLKYIDCHTRAAEFWEGLKNETYDHK